MENTLEKQSVIEVALAKENKLFDKTIFFIKSKI